MSYDIWGEAQIDGHTIQVWDAGNHTSNTSPMWAEALKAAGVSEWPSDYWKDRSASEAAPILARAVADMQRYPDKYLPMNPSNGWGSYESALAFLKKIEEGCREYPSSVIRAWC